MAGWGDVAELLDSDRRRSSWFVGGLNRSVSICMSRCHGLLLLGD